MSRRAALEATHALAPHLSTLLLGLHHRQLDPALPGRGADLGGDGALRPPPRRCCTASPASGPRSTRGSTRSGACTSRDARRSRRDVAYVMVANHQSLLDILVLFRLFVHFKWVSKIENFRVPCIGWNMSLNRYIKLRRGDRESVEQMMAACERTLAEGNSIMMFPEGTRSPDGRLQAVQARRLHAGAAHRACRSCRSSSRARRARCRSAASCCRAGTRSASACSTRSRTRASPTQSVEALTERVRALIAAELRATRARPPRLGRCSRPRAAASRVDFARAARLSVRSGMRVRGTAHAASRDFRTADGAYAPVAHRSGRRPCAATFAPPPCVGYRPTPRRLANLYLNRLEHRWLRTRLRSRPYKLIVEPINACNLRCPCCFTGAGGQRPRPLGHVDGAVPLAARRAGRLPSSRSRPSTGASR